MSSVETESAGLKLVAAIEALNHPLIVNVVLDYGAYSGQVTINLRMIHTGILKRPLAVHELWSFPDDPSYKVFTSLSYKLRGIIAKSKLPYIKTTSSPTLIYNQNIPVGYDKRHVIIDYNIA